MKIQYFPDTDTLYIEFKPVAVAETHNLDENTLLDLDREGNIAGITIEQAKKRADFPTFSYEQVAFDSQTRDSIRKGMAVPLSQTSTKPGW